MSGVNPLMVEGPLQCQFLVSIKKIYKKFSCQTYANLNHRSDSVRFYLLHLKCFLRSTKKHMNRNRITASLLLEFFR